MKTLEKRADEHAVEVLGRHETLDVDRALIYEAYLVAVEHDRARIWGEVEELFDRYERATPAKLYQAIFEKPFPNIKA